MTNAIELCVSEAVSNVVRYAYPKTAGSGTLLLSAQLDEARNLRIVVADQGVGLTGSTVPGGLGRGLMIMERLADEFRVASSQSAGTTVELTFRLPRD